MIALEKINKTYGDTRANHDVSLAIPDGKITAIVGENGAGKSTLLKIAYGETAPDSGKIVVDGEAVTGWSPAAAIARGVGMVHQHFMLIPTLDAVHNIVLGREPGYVMELDRPRRELVELSDRLGLELRWDVPISELSVGERQRIEILKVLWRGAKTLLLDEPTAVLTPLEVKDLFEVLRRLAGEGKAIAIVTHKLDEVSELADEVVVMRRGEVTGTLGRGASPKEIARLMIGGELPAETRAARSVGEEMLVVEDLRGLSFTIKAGEILGIAGVMGNGQGELVLALAGILPHEGRAVLDRRPLARAGVAHIPEDRHARGLIEDFTLAENLLLGRQREISLRDARRFAEDRLKDMDVRPADPDARAGSLSGGNQQKLVVARELSRPGLKLVLCAEPTRGVDIGATAVIHERIRRAAENGAAVLLVSSELSELRALADRIAVMFRGKIVGEVPVAGATDEVLGPLMTGAA